MRPDSTPSDDLMTPTDSEGARLLAELQALYSAPRVPDQLREHGAEQLRARFAQRGAGVPQRGWRIIATRGEPLPRRTAFVAIAAVALFCTLAVALFRPGLSGLSGLPGGLRHPPTPNSAQATQTAEAFNGIPPVRLYSVAMVSPTDGWAFGTSIKNGCLVLHYDGQSWKRSVGSACGYVLSISMLSADDGWALTAGSNYNEPAQQILHFTNGAWQVQATFPSPNQATPQADEATQWYDLRSIAMVSPTEGWAVGSTDYANQNYPAPVILRYSDGQWTPTSIVSLPANIASGAGLTGISMVSPTEGYAVGIYYGRDTGQPGYTYMLVLRYHNGTWSYVNWSEPGYLNGVYALPSGDMWGVGNINETSAVVHMRNGAVVSEVSPPDGSLYAIQIFSTPTGWQGWAVGDGAATVHDVNSVWKREGYTIHNYSINSISLTSPTEGWATGTLSGGGTGEQYVPNWDATLFHLHNGKWSVYPMTGF